MGKRIARERGVPNASCEPTLNRTQRVKVEDAAPAITCQIGRKDVLDDKAPDWEEFFRQLGQCEEQYYRVGQYRNGPSFAMDVEEWFESQYKEP
jgi:hypothetical protein